MWTVEKSKTATTFGWVRRVWVSAYLHVRWHCWWFCDMSCSYWPHCHKMAQYSRTHVRLQLRVQQVWSLECCQLKIVAKVRHATHCTLDMTCLRCDMAQMDKHFFIAIHNHMRTFTSALLPSRNRRRLGACVWHWPIIFFLSSLESVWLK